jgi:alcohol dehydrogenase class IV
MLPHVVDFNAGDEAVQPAYAELARAAGLVLPEASEERAVAELRVRLGNALRLAGLATALTDCAVDRSAIPELAGAAAGQWTAGFNPRPITADDFVKLYEAAFD